MLNRCYSELARLKTFEERFEYLKLSARIGEETFGFDRYLNQKFYNSPEWKHFRRGIIIRDFGSDLGIEGREIPGRIEIHHINPITIGDITDSGEGLFDPENVICTSPLTHKAIHFGDISLLPREPVERKPNDMSPWKW